MVLQQPMLATVMPVAEATIANDPLRTLATILIRAPDFLGWHAASQRHR